MVCCSDYISALYFRIVLMLEVGIKGGRDSSILYSVSLVTKFGIFFNIFGKKKIFGKNLSNFW